MLGLLILMTEVPEQSRKIGFVEVEEQGRAFFEEALKAHEVVFVRKLKEVPEDMEVLSVFIGEKIAERVHNAPTGSVGPVGREFSPTRMAEFSRLVTHSQLMKRPDVVLTPHVAFNSREAAESLAAITLENILNYLDGKPLKHLCA
jgi:hypothetical protein